MLEKIVKQRYNKEVSQCSNIELYHALLMMIKNLAKQQTEHQRKKKVYYISAEFLIGKLLSNNLINLGIYDDVKSLLEKNGKNLHEIEELDVEPSLGNGGLGRLAACFLDSIATLGLNGCGIGLNYHFGLFKQTFVNNFQKEIPNPWIHEESFLNKTDVSYTIDFNGFSLKSVMYNLDIVGYNNKTISLHLFDVESVDESIVSQGIDFDKTDVDKNLTLFLYPDDSDEKGRLLRVYQQYFMVSNAARLIIDEALSKGSTLYDLYDYAVIQINDTHPSMIIPELIRLLLEKGITMNDAISIVSKTCAYTNHTILAEALEKWPLSFLKNTVPQLVPIIFELNNQVLKTHKDNSLSIIDNNSIVHMAHMDIHYCFSVNGVAHLHTEILKESELNNFYNIYPGKFNNKTNGITFRRWLLHSNYELTNYLEHLIGSEFKTNSNCLKNLLHFKDDTSVLQTLLNIKKHKKDLFVEYIKNTSGISLDSNSIFDVQIKRFHEYKRQQLFALYVIHKYFEIKEGKIPPRCITVIFGGKAAPAYVIAKDVIHLILCLQQLINNDKDVSPFLKVVMVENYNVSVAEKLIPAADIHEQISLASKEASGTSNMKFMLNGAIAVGTMDGANVEIHNFVGNDNIYIFGETSDQIIEHYKNKDYVAKEYYESDYMIKRAVDFIISDEMISIGNKESLLRLYNELINKDWFMTLLDFNDYVNTKEQMYNDFENRIQWAKKMLINISNAGFFSSDRTISQYNEDIWHL